MSHKSETLKITNNLSSSGEAHIKDGFIFLGKNYMHNGSLSEEETLPPKSYAGTSETRGNVSRNLMQLNNNGPIKFSPTNDDIKRFGDLYDTVFSDVAWASKYPWATVLDNWSGETKLAIDNNIPIYKCLGKGLGNIQFFKTGVSTLGSKSSAGSSTINFENGNTITTMHAESHPPVIYPYSGTIYAGTLVQLVTEIVSGKKVTKVIPYQTGRGNLYSAINYLVDDISPITPDLDPPYGHKTWNPDQNEIPSLPDIIDTYLAPGVEPGDSSMCVGMVLDTYSTELPNRRLFNYREPTLPPQPLFPEYPFPPYGPHNEQLNEYPYTPWFNHPAPFTVQAESFDGKFVSPRNTSDTNLSPWPIDYAYQENDPIPVLTKGITTARIGAAYNIAIQSYGFPVKSSTTLEEWIPSFSLPLFEGEELQAGSYVYAAVKGHSMTLGPSNEEYGEPYSTGVRDLTENEKLLKFGPNPWDPWIESTGSIGWTGTPATSFSNIPDQGYATIEGLGTFRTNALPYLNQSTQGSIIIHPITIAGLTPTIGSNGFLRFYPDFENKNGISDPLNFLIGRSDISGISGRCNLVQSPPEKSVPIGVVLESVKGKGKWTYTGLITNGRTVEVAELSDGGGSLVNIPGGATPIYAPTRTSGAGTGLTVTWTGNITDPPNLGTITVLDGTPVVSGGGYADGDILTITNDEAVIAPASIYFWKDNNVSLIYSLTGPTITLQKGGSGYSLATEVSTHNLSLNNLYIRENTDGSGAIVQTTNISDSNYPTDLTRYGVNSSQIILLEDGVPSINSAILVVNSDTNDFVTVQDGGSGYTASGSGLLFESQVLGKANPEISIDSIGSSGEITAFSVIDYGVGNQSSDIILVISGDNNATVSMPNLPYGEQEIISGAPLFVLGDTYQVMKAGTGVEDVRLTVASRAENVYGLPSLMDIQSSTLGALDDGTVFNTVFNLGTNRIKTVTVASSLLLLPNYIKAASVGNINIGAPTPVPFTLDGIAINDSDNILLKDQTDELENGIYTYGLSSNILVRSVGSEYSSPAKGDTILVYKGDTQNSTVWRCDTLGGIYGITDITFDKIAQTAFRHPAPWYVPRRSAVIYKNDPVDIPLHRGGSNYSTATGVETYNLTANQLQFAFNFESGDGGGKPISSISSDDLITSKIPESFRPQEYSFSTGRYSFGETTGTDVTLLEDGVVSEPAIFKLLNVNDLNDLTIVSGSISGYSTDTIKYFQTQRTDQINPNVNIIVSDLGFVKRVQMTDIGTNNQNGDLILIKQEGSDLNAIFEYNESLLASFDYPPYIKVPNGIVPSDSEAWRRYKDVLTGAENLLDKQILIELRPTMHNNTLENIYPAATANGNYPPQNVPKY
jgi:hypothetical protein